MQSFLSSGRDTNWTLHDLQLTGLHPTVTENTNWPYAQQSALWAVALTQNGLCMVYISLVYIQHCNWPYAQQSALWAVALTQTGMGNVNTVTLYVKGVKKKNTKVKWTNIDNIITLNLPKKKEEKKGTNFRYHAWCHININSRWRTTSRWAKTHFNRATIIYVAILSDTDTMSMFMLVLCKFISCSIR